MKKRSLAVIVAGATVASLTLVGATTATWSDATTFQGETLVAGDLDMKSLGPMAWVDNTHNLATPVADVSAFEVVPNDKLEGTQGYDVKLVGDNVLAAFSVETPTPTGSLLADANGANGVRYTYDIVGKGGKLLAENISFGQQSPWLNLKPADLTSADGTYDNQADIIFRLKASFDPNTPNRVATNAQAVLGAATVTMNQTRGEIQGTSVKVTSTAALTVDTGTPGVVDAGDTVTYTFTVQNDGGNALHDLTFSDPVGSNLGVTFSPSSVATLKPFETRDFTIAVTGDKLKDYDHITFNPSVSYKDSLGVAGEVSLLKSPIYTTARGTKNLVVNGDGSHGVSNWYYTAPGVAPPAGVLVNRLDGLPAGALAWIEEATEAPSAGSNAFYADLIPYDHKGSYTFTGTAMSGDGAVPSPTLFGWYDYDVDRRQISDDHVAIMPGTTTELAADLNHGDTVVHLKDAYKWTDKQIDGLELPATSTGFLIWNYKDSTGCSALPELKDPNTCAYLPETYSRNSMHAPWGPGAIDKEKNTIELKTPWRHAHIKKGTPLSQRRYGGYGHFPFIGSVTYGSPKTASATFTGFSNVTNKLDAAYYGTYYIAPMISANRAPGTTTRWTDFRVVKNN